jgi:hypothetical protein
MAWYSKAANHKIPPGTNDPVISPRIIVIHTMVGTIESADSWFRGGSGGVEAHFGVAMDGRVWQWRDTSRQADAQAAGNDYCISIETEDKGNPEQRWTAIQFQKLVELVTWLGVTHNIPMVLVTSTSDRGIGYHRQFTSWNPNNHSCPGDTRLAQLKNELLPALNGDVMTDAQMTELKQYIDLKMREGVRYVEHGDPKTGFQGNTTLAIREDIAAVKNVVDALVPSQAPDLSQVDAAKLLAELNRRLAA